MRSVKERFVSLSLCLLLALSLAPVVKAEGFTDISDPSLARSVEVLRLMGIIEGDGKGAFRPGDSLTRAEFCKMAVVLTGKRNVVARYGSRTVFPDVPGSHWAAGYVNYAASKDVGLIHGMPDGSFQPSRSIKFGEAVAILTRQLGYTDSDTAGIWPDGYIDLAREAGMLEGLSIWGGDEITRAQAAQLFVNALTAKNDKKETLLSVLGYSVDLKADPVTLYSVDVKDGKLRLSDKSDPKLENTVPSTQLDGIKGRVVKNSSGEAVTFLPVTGSTGGVASAAAIIVAANGSTAGFDALTGNSRNYSIYRNGVRVSSAELKKNDVAIYDAANNNVLVTDTRVAVYYEDCEPSRDEPATIKVLNNTAFSVLPTARQSLAAFKPGQTMVLLLTADGQVAGAVANNSGVNSNALAYVSLDRRVSLICGGTLRELSCSGGEHENQVVRISQTGKAPGGVYLSRQSVKAEALDAVAGKLGGYFLSPDAVIIDGGYVTSLSALGVTRVEKDRVAYYRLGASGAVELVVLSNTAGDVFYGRAIITNAGLEDGTLYKVAVDYGTGVTDALITGHSPRYGDYVAATIDNSGNHFSDFVTLTRLASVPESAWIGDSAVIYNGETYTIDPKTVLCYNRSAGSWMKAPSADKTAFDAAKDYGGIMDLYALNNVIHIIECRN